MELFKWQRECLVAWEKHGCRGIVNVVTGAGKTVLALAAMDRWLKGHPGGMVKIVVPTIPLAHQWKTALRHHVDRDALRPGFFGGGARDGDDTQVMIYIVNSARQALSTHVRRALSLNRAVLLICDECHHYQSPQNRRIFDFLTPGVLAGGLYACLGLSATPFGGEDDGLLMRALGEEIYRYGFEAAVGEGILSPFVVCETAVSFLPEERMEYARLSSEIIRTLAVLEQEYPGLLRLGREKFMRAVSRLAHAAGMDSDDPSARFLRLTYERKQVTSLARSRVACGMALLSRLCEGDRVLIFCERIVQAEEMVARIRRRWGDGRCALYHSEMTAQARANSMRAFREGEARVLVSCRCLDEGVDVPEANIGIVLSGSAVSRQRIQRMGRILRRAPGKDTACLYYLYVREASEDAAFLPRLDSCDSFSLRYYSLEDTFSNELYEYAAGDLLNRAREARWEDDRLSELRRCLEEGLTRADCLLPVETLESRARTAKTKHARNYLRAMQGMSRAFHE